MLSQDTMEMELFFEFIHTEKENNLTISENLLNLSFTLKYIQINPNSLSKKMKNQSKTQKP